MHRFRDLAFDMSNVAIFAYPSCVLPPSEGFPYVELRKILHGSEWMARLQNGVEILSKILTGCVGCTKVTDRRQMTTDRQTEWRYQIPECNVVMFG